MYKLTKQQWLAITIIPQFIVVKLLSGHESFVETYYSQGIYPLISKIFRYVLGWLPFSFGDLMYTMLIVLILRSLFLLIRSKFKHWKSFVGSAFASVSIVYFLFHALWGLNYYRQPLNESLGIENEYTKEDLIQLTERLIVKSNILHSQLANSDSSAVVYAFAKADIFNKTITGYETLKQQFPQLDYPPKSIKTSLLSYPLSVMGYSGYLNPISLEAQINGLMPQYHWPVVSCHEQAHQLGFAKENEANFMAVLATINNPDPYFQYSGSIFALRYCLNDLHRRDATLAKRLREKVRPGIYANYQESRDFWDSFENPIEPIIDTVYNSFLKANNQPGGVKTYSYMVALLVNYNASYPNKF